MKTLKRLTLAMLALLPLAVGGGEAARLRSPLALTVIVTPALDTTGISATVSIPRFAMFAITETAIGKRNKMMVFGDDYDTPDGTGVRDYIHVLDLAEGHVAAVEHLEDNPGFDVINLGTGNGISVLELVAAFERVAGVPIPTQVVERRPGDGPASWADASKAAAVLGWTASRDLDEMVADVWRWQSQNPDGYPD